jgi:pSer/pThr/pTyr-binding forkhead associated (FHA) protein
MFAIAANALYTALRRRGTTRQLASAIIVCTISALLLLPAIIWFNMRFSVKQAILSGGEIGIVLAYIALFGWLLPLSITAAYCLFSLPRSTTTALHIPRQKGASSPSNTLPPRSQPGVLAPFVFSEDTPWCWLEYCTGNFQGQRLALKRAIAIIGRGEECDIWLDDDMVSRHHAELRWREGHAYLTDCESMNGMLLNEKPVLGSVVITSRDVIEIGSQRFLFLLAERTADAVDDDPLAHHTWRSSLDPLNQGSAHLPSTTQAEATHVPMVRETASSYTLDTHVQQTTDPVGAEASLGERLGSRPEPSLPDGRMGTLIFQSAEWQGKSFSLNRPVITLGRGIECDIVVNDASISRWHAQFLRQVDGDYVQDLTSRNGTRINDEALTSPRLLQPGDIVCVGSIQIAYSSSQTTRVTPTPQTMLPSTHTLPGSLSRSGPVPLRLPSKPKEH